MLFRSTTRKIWRNYYYRHQDRLIVRVLWYRKTHPEIDKQNKARRRAQKASAPLNDFTAAQWREIKAVYGHRCVYCGKKPHVLTMDHIIPLSQDGSHTWSNIVPACRSCNSRKGAKPPLQPLQPLMFLIAPSRRNAHGQNECPV